eukprot:gene25718-31057_t
MLAVGSVVAGAWRIQSYLGEGACAKVYSVTPATGQTIDYELVAKVIPLPTGSTTSKGYKDQNRICNTLFYEYTLYTGLLASATFVPRRPLKFYGDDQTLRVRYLVMERLECDLVALASNPCLTYARLGDIGLQIFAGLQWLHQRNFLFIDMKPDNFMVKGDKVYFVDFGLVERNNLNAGKPASFAGTPSYSSLAVHQGGHPSFKDEVESLGYVLLAVALGGNLPWTTATSMEETLRMKAGADIHALCRQHSCPEIAELIYAMRAIEGSQKYSVEAVTGILHQLAARNVPIRGQKASKGEKRSKSSASSTTPRKKIDAQPSPEKRGRNAVRKREEEEVIVDGDVEEVVDAVPLVETARRATKPAAAKAVSKARGKIPAAASGKVEQPEMDVVDEKEDVPNRNISVEERGARGPFRLSSPQRTYTTRTRAAKGPFSLS